ncbi:hypothetical protein SteCoe_29514 [Stentor coeruleus]|uniref:Uncharacterized protein n=1 Tax=Stentor coeruleus TaxID=5963 RepID=A0A1R2B5Q9_9CILI|nr:hypothetical protein SteCoe_29514 [Stentor coeruleus]
MANFQLEIDSSPQKIFFGNFSLLTELESERTPHNPQTSEINDIKSQLDIVNEDRERLKHEINILSLDFHNNYYNLISQYSNYKVREENQKLENLKSNIEKLRKDCEEKDKLLETMRKLLGSNDLSYFMKENHNETNDSQTVKMYRNNRSTTKIKTTGCKIMQKRSMSPYKMMF